MARVAKLADARDLKSLDVNHRGSIPLSRTKIRKHKKEYNSGQRVADRLIRIAKQIEQVIYIGGPNSLEQVHALLQLGKKVEEKYTPLGRIRSRLGVLSRKPYKFKRRKKL